MIIHAKTRLLSKNSLIKNHWEFLLIAYASFLPYGTALTNICYGIIIGCWVIDVFLGKVKISQKDLGLVLVFSGFYLMSLISLSYSNNFSRGIEKILLQSFILIMPIVLISKKKMLTKELCFKIIYFFSTSLALLCSLSFLNQTRVFILSSSSNFSLFFENNLSTSVVDYYFLGLSLMVGFVLVINLYMWLNHKSSIHKFYKKWMIPIIAFMFLTLIFLNSRTVISVTLFLGTLMVLFKSLKNKKYLFIIPIVLMVVYGNVKFNSFFSNKLKEAFAYEQYENSFWGGRGMRFLIWGCAVKVIEENPVIGVGVGDQRDTLTLCYNVYMMDEILFKGGASKNAHNIFLQIGIATGLIGIFLFLLSFVLPVYWSYIYNKFYLIFVTFFILSALTESYLERNLSIAFYSFFNMLCFLSFKKE